MKPCKLFLCDLYYYMIELFGFREQHMPLEMLHSIRQNFTWSWNQSFQQWWNSWKTQWQKLGQMPQVCIYIVPVLVHEHIHQISGYFWGGGVIKYSIQQESNTRLSLTRWWGIQFKVFNVMQLFRSFLFLDDPPLHVLLSILASKHTSWNT